MDFYVYMGCVLGGAIIIAILAMSGKFFMFGLSHFFNRRGGKYGLLFLRTKDGNITIPKFVPLDKEEAIIKVRGTKLTYPYTRDEFTKGRFFGMPFAIKDYDDANVSYGLLCPKVDKTGKTLYQTVKINGEEYALTDYPIYHEAKNAGVVSPELHQAVVAKEKLIVGIRDMFSKQNTLMILTGVAIVVGLVACYIGYENMTLIQETLIPTINAMKSQVGTTIITGG